MMKIRTKLFLGFGTLMLLLFALAGIGINRLTTIDESMNEIYGNRYMKVQFSTILRNDTSELSKNLATLLLNDQPANTPQLVNEIRVATDKVTKSMDQVAKTFTGPNEQQLAAEMLRKAQQFLVYKDHVVHSYQAGEQIEANDLRTSAGLTYQQDLLDSISALTRYEEEAMTMTMTRNQEESRKTYAYTGVLTIAGLVLSIAIMFWIVIGITRGLVMLSGIISNFGNGHSPGAYRSPVNTTDEFGGIARIFNEISENLEETTKNERALSQLNADQAWLQKSIAEISTQLQGTHRLEEMSGKFISALCLIVGAQSGAMYIVEQEGTRQRLSLKGAYAHGEREANHDIEQGQGLIGQCMLDGNAITLTDVTPGYVKVSAAFGHISPVTLAIRPVKYIARVIAVFEVAALKPFSALELKLLDALNEMVAVTIHRIDGRLRVEELLRISQMLTDELQASNNKLEEQTKALQSSEQLLQQQQRELEHSNDELLKNTKLLENQIKETEEINRQIEHAKDALEKQTRELAFSSKYKSEFMANMSHELRTPLNSLLILSQLLKENKEGNLSPRQVEYADTMYSSGTDLLRLIDDVLDLAKVESGRMELQFEHVPLHGLMESLRKSFLPVATKKELQFDLQIDPEAPDFMHTDSMRLLQILRNLLSNAFKFTSEGSVSLQVGLDKNDPSMLVISVKDTGIGIPAEKRKMIFEAFQQADGTTSRKYGGTGLGLSISRELVSLLGGRIELDSAEGKGSRFAVYVPHNEGSAHNSARREAASAADRKAEWLEINKPNAQTLALPLTSSSAAKPSPKEQPRLRANQSQEAANMDLAVTDDRDLIDQGDRVLLIIEDDVHFVKILMDIAHTRGFKVIATVQGDKGLSLAKQYKPDAILLDIQLPVIDGWSILVQLKNDSEMRHIPVHVISVVDEMHKGLSMGAFAYLQKPSGKERLEEAFEQIEAFLNKGTKKLLIVSRDKGNRENMIELIDYDDLDMTAADGGHEAWDYLGKQSFDCMVIDMGPADVREFELLDQIKAEERLTCLPIVIYTDQVWEQKDKLRLKKYAESMILKDVRSPERLLDETALFLHRVEDHLPEQKQRILRKLHSDEHVFAGKKVLLVDDDIRNVFALSNILESYKMKVVFAETGVQALERLAQSADYDIVLMDIMMPEMDGYEAMRAIRGKTEYEQLPIIALTAKAMKEDREKAIKAGASDYITKPIHTDQLLSLIRVWLYQ